MEAYRTLSRREGFSAAARFDEDYFRGLARLPQLTTFAAFQGAEFAAAALWLRSGSAAYYHLGASTPAGYQTQAMYGLMDAALAYFRDCRWLDLGGVAGSADVAADGLTFFKRGFANDAKSALLCGAVLDREAYAALVASSPPTDYFPAYRAARAKVAP